MLEMHFSSVEISASFPVVESSPRDVARSVLKRLAVRLGLIPKTMRGKRLFKRLFFGGLIQVPAEVTDGLAPYVQPIRIPATGPCPGYKMLSAVALA
jgi:hypothetical protein